MTPAPFTIRPLEKVLLDWAVTHRPDLIDRWNAAKIRQEQAEAAALMLDAVTEHNPDWLLWASRYHGSDLRSLLRYTAGPLRCLPPGMVVVEYIQVLENVEAF